MQTETNKYLRVNNEFVSMVATFIELIRRVPRILFVYHRYGETSQNLLNMHKDR